MRRLFLKSWSSRYYINSTIAAMAAEILSKICGATDFIMRLHRFDSLTTDLYLVYFLWI